jgi:dTMP kinase
MRNLQRGLYVIFEGADFVGKSTTMHMVIEKLLPIISSVFPDIVIRETHHPGSTPLGKHLRQLVKYPTSIAPDIEIDDLSRQMLYMVDTVAFVKSVLMPALANNEIVFADRSTFISALAYGSADGLSITDILRIFSVMTPPKADRVYILQCPWSVGKTRIHKERTNLDHYDKMNDEYHDRLEKIYDTLVTGPAERTIAVSTCVAIDDIQYIDTNTNQEAVIATIISDLLQLITEREDVSFN